MISRRSLLLGTPAALFAAKPAIRVGATTSSFKIDPNNFETLTSAVMQLKQLGFEGFATPYQNLREQFAKPDQAYDRLHKTGMRLLGIQVALKSYDPQTAIAPWSLIQSTARG